jgi:regulator of protease activity HflC (stomatin/prohibitin superfamily)
LGGLLSLAGAVILAVLAIWSGSSCLWGTSFQMLGAVGICLLTLIQLHQERLVREEEFEVAELERLRQEKLGGAKTIFEEEDLDQMDKLAMARRLRTIERVLVPVIALLVAAYHLAAGIVIFPWVWQFPPIADALGQPILHPKVLLFAVGAFAFISFMFSRYALGMSRLPTWGLLRAPGDFMFGSSALCLATAVGLLCVISGLERVEVWLGGAIGFLLMFLAFETIVNFILDFYRPRVPGQAQRPFYDSRLLGIFSEPGGILRSVANAMDYQFGFKVSETWFYKLLGRDVMPLLLVQGLVILALTCVVIVPPGHQAVIERFGTPCKDTAKPGIHLTWFWPIDRATVIPVERIQRFELGHAAQVKKDELQGPILWTKRHWKEEYRLLVGDRNSSTEGRVPINLLSLDIPVQWRVKDGDTEVIRYHAQSSDAPAIVESLAYHELTRYVSQADILDLLGEGGIQAAEDLHNRIQAACNSAGYDGKGLGVQIVYVGIGGVHPPPDEDVAKAYEDVVSAYETKDALIKAAQGDAAMLRLASGGIRWETLYKAIVAEDEAREAEDQVARLAASREVERILGAENEIGGAARERAANAERDAIRRVFGEMANSERYKMQLLAYEAAPETYLLRVYLRMLREGLKGVQKYVVAVDDPSRVLYQLDLKPRQAVDILGAEQAAGEIRQLQQQQ